MTDRLGGIGSLLAKGFRNFNSDHGANHAAAVAYFSLLSLPPFVLIAGSLLRLLIPDASGTELTLAAVAPFLPVEIAPSLGAVAEGLHGDGTLVAVAAPVLIWVASHAFSALEVAINVAFGTTPQRRFWLSRLKAFAGLSGGVLLLGGTIVTGQALTWLERHEVLGGSSSFVSSRTQVVSVAGLVLVSTAVFALFYKWLPRGKVSWVAAAKGAFVAALLWEGARHLFGALLLGSPAFGLFSGALAGIVAVLAWVYVAVVVTIYGAELAAVLNGNRGSS